MVKLLNFLLVSSIVFAHPPTGCLPNCNYIESRCIGGNQASEGQCMNSCMNEMRDYSKCGSKCRNGVDEGVTKCKEYGNQCRLSCDPKYTPPAEPTKLNPPKPTTTTAPLPATIKNNTEDKENKTTSKDARLATVPTGDAATDSPKETATSTTTDSPKETATSAATRTTAASSKVSQNTPSTNSAQVNQYVSLSGLFIILVNVLY